MIRGSSHADSPVLVCLLSARESEASLLVSISKTGSWEEAPKLASLTSDSLVAAGPELARDLRVAQFRRLPMRERRGVLGAAA